MLNFFVTSVTNTAHSYQQQQHQQQQATDDNALIQQLVGSEVEEEIEATEIG